MGKSNHRGVIVPEADDDLLQAAQSQADNLLVVTVAASARAANEIVAANREKVSAQTPMIFLLHGSLLCIHDGTGLVPVNEVERYNTGFELPDEVTYTLKYGEYKKLASLTIPARPYRRECVVSGSVLGSAEEGKSMDLCVLVDGVLTARSHFRAGGATSVATMASIEVAAGSQCKVELAARCSMSGSGYVWLMNSATHNQMTARLSPIAGGSGGW